MIDKNITKSITFENIKNKNITETMKEIKIESNIDFEIMDDMIYGQIIPNCITLNEKELPELNYITVEIIKRFYIIDNLTNIKLYEIEKNETKENDENTDSQINIPIDFANWTNKIWDKLIKKIKNYELFENILNKAIDKEFEKLTKLEYKISEVIDSIQDVIKKYTDEGNLKKLFKSIDPSLISKLTKILPQLQNNQNNKM